MMLYQLVVALVVVLPSTGASRCLTSVKEVNPKRYLNVNGNGLQIRLEVSRRISHRLSTHVFKIFLEEVLGYANVRIVDQEDYFNTTQVFDRLSGPEGDNQSSVPTSMVNLEVWVPGDEDVVSFLNIKHVKECGYIAPPGRFGWFIPTRLSRLVPQMDDWRIFSNPDTASLFDVSQSQMNFISEFTKNTTSNRYFCEEDFCEDGFFIPKRCQSLRHKTQPCALLFAADTDVTRFVVNHIKEMELFVKVVWVGPHLKELTDNIVDSYIREVRNNSLVVLSWTPSVVIRKGAKTEYRPVLFPQCEITVAGQSHSAGCKYEQHRLVKLAWAKLEKGASTAFEAIHKVYFTQENYTNLLELYDKESQHNSMPEIACNWLTNNEYTWRQWVPRTEEKNKLYIFGIFPISGTGYTAKGIVTAALMAMKAVNDNDSILRDYQLKILINNGMCKADVVMKTFIDYIIDEEFGNLVGVLGPACSDTVEPLVGITKHFKTVVISYSAEGSSFSDRTLYPYFFRTIGENKQYTDVYLRLFKKMGWKRGAALTEDGQKYTEYLTEMQAQLQDQGINITNEKFSRVRTESVLTQQLEKLKDNNVRIIIADIHDSAARDFMCKAYHLKMTARQGYVWFLPLWLSPDWYNTDRYNRGNNGTHCNTSQMIDAINGHLALTHSYFAEDSAMMQENKSVGEWRKDYKKICNTHPGHVAESNYAGYAYDAVWAYALALDKLNKEDQSYLSDIHSSVATKRYVDMLSKTDFQGVSGHIRFLGGGPSRVSTINVVQWLNNSTHIVGSFIPRVVYEDKKLNGGE